MIEIRKTVQSDAEFIDCSEVSGIDPFSQADYCFTLLSDEKLIAILGGTVQVIGCYRLFMLLPKDPSRKPLMYTKAARAILAKASNLSNDIQRIECTVRNDFESGKNWARMLGFVEEGLLHDYDPKDSEDHLIYYLPKSVWKKGAI